MSDRKADTPEPGQAGSSASESTPGVAAPTRREFITRTAAAAAAAGGLGLLSAGGAHAAVDEAPIPLAGRRPPLRDGEPVRIGVIGTGGMGTEHCRAFLRLVKADRTDMQIVALADVCTLRLEKTRAEVQTAYVNGDAGGTTVAVYTDYRQLLADPTIHGVLIAAPEHWHARMAEDAIAAGKDVYVEKPVTLRLDEALRLRRVVHANPDVRLVVGTQYVMEAAYPEAYRLIAEGAIGKPVSSQTSYCRNSKAGEWLYYAIDPEWQPGVNIDWNAWCGPLGRQPWDPHVYARWRRYRKYSTGIIGDLLVHRMTPLMMALNVGWPTRVIASGGHYIDKAMENHDQININIEFEGEHTMIVAGSTCNEVGLETIIRGHRANLYLAGRRLTMRPERIYAEEVEEHSYEGENRGGTQDQLRVHWIDIIRTRAQPASDIDLAAQVMVAVDLATRSAWEGRAFSFDPRRMRVRSA
jgi:predicted dehydrogenase